MKAKKIIIPVSIIAGVAAIGVAIAALGSSAATVAYADTIKIQAKTIENKISVSGTVKSAEVKKVYSELSYPVEKINVSVGDAVKKGDVLCTIRTDDLQQQILQQQYTVDSSGLSEEYNLSSAEEKYNDALTAYENGENATIMSAEKAVRQAEQALEKAKRDKEYGVDVSLSNSLGTADKSVSSAKKAYDDSVKAYEKAVKELDPDNYPVQVRQIYEKYTESKESLAIIQENKFNSELESAKKEYDEAYEKYTIAVNTGVYTAEETEEITAEYTKAKAKLEEARAKYDEETLKEKVKSYEDQHTINIQNLEAARDNAKKTMDAALEAYEKALETYDDTKVGNSNSAEDLSNSVKNAETALEDARKNYELAVQQVESDLAALKKAAEQQRTLSGLNNPQLTMLENLKEKLEYAVVVAPCDGVVTAVNAEEGVMASGAIFVIEDLSSLKISASVGEYDIPYVSEGMEATVKCDAVSGVEYGGKVSSVAPTGVPGSSGTSYAIEADIDGEDGKILVGMSAKVSIISDKRENALTVTYDALTTDENGNDAVYIAEKDENGVYRAKLVTVEIGLETDYEIEIISNEISEGMYVLTNTTMLSDGDMVVINESETESDVEVAE